MEGNKPWYKSKGVLGSLTASVTALVPVIAFIMATFGYNISPELQQQAAELINSGIITIFTAVSTISALIGLWGRVDATKKIGKSE